MFYNHQLRTNLQEWKNRFLKSDFETSYNQFKFLFERINRDKTLVSILTELENKMSYPDEQINKYLKEGLQYLIFDDELDHVGFNYSFCKWLLKENKDIRYSFYFAGDRPKTVEYIKDNIVSPVIDYLHDQLDVVSNVLYILEKYKLRTEWFTKKDLLSKYKNADKSYEELLEDDLRLFLFDQGIDYPFSTPKSASGRADVVSRPLKSP